MTDYIYHSEYDYIVKNEKEAKEYGNAKAESLCLQLKCPVQFNYSTILEDDKRIVKFYIYEEVQK